MILAALIPPINDFVKKSRIPRIIIKPSMLETTAVSKSIVTFFSSDTSLLTKESGHVA